MIQATSGMRHTPMYSYHRAAGYNPRLCVTGHTCSPAQACAERAPVQNDIEQGARITNLVLT